MTLKLENKVIVPTPPDIFRPTQQLADMGNSINPIIPVLTRGERDALTKYRGLTVSRQDMPGAPLQIWDGDSWEHQGRTKKTLFINSGLTNVTGVGSRLLADLALPSVDYDRIMTANAQLGISSATISSGVYQIYGAVSLRQASVSNAQGKAPLSWTVPGGYRQGVSITTGEILIPANATPMARMWMETISGSVSTTVDADAAVTKFWSEEYPA